MPRYRLLGLRRRCPGNPTGAAKHVSTVRRQRRTPEAVRVVVLDAARELLLKSGPEPVTLPAIARELGMSHGNITHHFGSVGALHAALVDQMATAFASR